jgi:hypothetical protein
MPGSTIAEAGLNFRVRNGNGCGPCSMDGGKTVLIEKYVNRTNLNHANPRAQHLQ